MPDAGHMQGGKPIVPHVEPTLYTLEEAQAHLAQRECVLDGHVYNFITDAGGDPIKLLCDKCFKTWEVTDA